VPFSTKLGVNYVAGFCGGVLLQSSPPLSLDTAGCFGLYRTVVAQQFDYSIMAS
jgi:hypothetical protein